MTQPLDKLLKENGLSDYAAQIVPHVRPTLYLTLGEAGEGLGYTRIFGSPDLPPDFVWPVDEDGDPYTFFLQVNLADLPTFEGNPFPAVGLLSVFGNLDKIQNDRAGVYLFPDAGQCQRREQIHDVNEILADVRPHHLNVVLGDGLPLWASNDEEALLQELLEVAPDGNKDELQSAYGNLTQALAPGHTVARLLGHAAGIGRDLREDAYIVREHNFDMLFDSVKREKLDMTQAQRWQHFLTIDSSQELGLCICDAGYWQLLIKDDDLEALKFKDIYAAEESS